MRLSGKLAGVGLAVALLFQASAVRAQEELNLGIFAYRPKPVMVEQYQPLVDHLNRSIPGIKIRMLALDISEIEAALEAGKLDLVFTNPSHFMLLRHRNRLTGALATLVSLDKGIAVSSLGGAILAPADRSDIQTLKDLKGRKIAYPGTKYLGGYQTQAYELLMAGIHLPDDANLVNVGGHDSVVKTLLANGADAGFVRTGIFEAMIREGSLPEGRLKLVNPQKPPSFPFLVSTRLYPEWAFAALPHVNERLVRQIARALFDVEPDSKAAKAAGIHGFTVPADYLPVENLARVLRLPPFEQAPEFTAQDVWEHYFPAILVGLGALSVIAVLMVFLALGYRRLKVEQGRVLESEARRKRAYELLNRQAQDLKRANQELEQFAYVASHDMRQPLRMVTSYLNLIKKRLGERIDSDMADFIGFATDGAKRMDALITGLLEYSRTGRNLEPFQPVSLSTVVADAIQNLKVAIDETAASVTLKPGLPSIMGDRMELTRLFQNLIGNALKYHSPERSPAIAVEWEDMGDAWRIVVADNGTGFDPKHKDRMFAIFQRLVPADHCEGTGIGLALCRKIAEHHGGLIDAESTPGEGSRFILVFPKA